MSAIGKNGPLIGQIADVIKRLMAALPPWFPAPQVAPVFNALLTAISDAFAFIYQYLQFASLQTRIKTATGGWLDLIAWDFFGARFGRRYSSVQTTRTNYVLESNTFSNVAWLLTNSTIAGGVSPSPFNTADAWLWQRNSVQPAWAGQTLSRPATAIPWTFSIYAKAGNGTFLAMYLSDSFGDPNAIRATFNLANGTIATPVFVGAGTVTNIDASITPAGNGFYRCAINGTMSVDSGLRVRFGGLSSNTVLEAVDSAANTTIYVYGAQLEQADMPPAPTAYIPTTVAPVTVTTQQTISGEADSFFAQRIVQEILRPRQTRAAIAQMVEDLTGAAPQIQEAWNPYDWGCWGNPAGGCGYGIGRGYGSLQYPNQVFVTVLQPTGTGIPNVGGYGKPFYGAYGAVGASYVYSDLSQVIGAVTQSEIYQRISQVIAAGTIAWVAIVSAFKQPGLKALLGGRTSIKVADIRSTITGGIPILSLTARARIGLVGARGLLSGALSLANLTARSRLTVMARAAGTFVASATALTGRAKIQISGRESITTTSAPLTVISGLCKVNNVNFTPGSYSFTGMNGGANWVGPGTVVVTISHDQSIALTGITIGGLTPTLAVGESGNHEWMYYVDLASGQSVPDTVGYTGVTTTLYVGACAWFLANAATGGPASVGSQAYGSTGNTGSVTVTVPSGGVAIAGLEASYPSGTWPTPTWTNTTSSAGDNRATGPTQIEVGGAHNLTPGGQTITVTDGSSSGGTGMYFSNAMVAGAWGPGAGGGGAPPVVTNGSFSITLPVTSGQTVGTMTATNSPTSWTISGTGSANFNISSTGVITVSATGASSLTAGTYTLTVNATNAYGTGGGTATIVVNPAPTGGATFQELILGGGGYFTGIQMLSGGLMVIHNDSGSGYFRSTAAAGSDVWRPLLNANNMPGNGTVWGWSNGEIGGSWVLGNVGLSGSLYDVQAAPSDPQKMYALWLGYMIYSADQGHTWTIMSNFPTANYTGDANASVSSERFIQKKIRIDPANANRVIISTPANGFYMTSNGTSGASATFTALSGLGVPAPGTRNWGGCIDYDTTSGTTGGFTNRIALSNGSGIYISTNAGASFSLSSGSPAGSIPCDGVFTGGRYLYTSGDGSNMSMLNAGTWYNVVSPQGGCNGIAVDPTDANHIAVCGGDEGGGFNQGTISGNSITWYGHYGYSGATVSASGTDCPWHVDITYPGITSFGGACAFDTATSGANGAGRVWFCTGYSILWIDLLSKTAADGSWVTAHSIAIGTESTDGNYTRTINSSSYPKPLCAVDDLQVFQIANPDAAPAQGTPSPRSRSTNASAWSMDVSESVPGLVCTLCDGYYVNAGTASGYSLDGGTTWTLFPTAPWTNTSGPGGNLGTYGGQITCTDRNHFLAVSIQSSVTPIYSADGGSTWNVTSGLPTGHWAAFFGRSVNFCNDAGGNMYAYFNPGGVYRSTNGGANFSNMSTRTDICSNMGSMQFRSVPGQTGYLFITCGFSWPGSGGGSYPSTGTTNQFWYSTNGGATWTQVPNVSDVWCFGFGQPYPGKSVPTLWIYGFAGPGGVQKKWGIWRSNDLGVSGNDWTRAVYWDGGVNIGEGSPVSLSGDMNDYKKCYISYPGGGFRYGKNIT